VAAAPATAFVHVKVEVLEKNGREAMKFEGQLFEESMDRVLELQLKPCKALKGI
jgi:hypothetical protein